MNVEVVKLPTIGAAYSMKTIRQGRSGSLNENAKSDPIYVRKRDGDVYSVGTKNLRRDNSSVAIFNAKRISVFKHATPKQKACAVKVIENFKEGVFNSTELKIVLAITRSLSKKYREF